MKIKNVFFLVSIGINVFLGILLLTRPKFKKEDEHVPAPITGISFDSFEKIFFEDDQKTFRELYNELFENYPLQAYLLACTKFLQKKDSVAIKDIEMINSEIKGIFGKYPTLNLQ